MRAEQERELAEAEQFAATNSFGFTLYLTNAQGEVTGPVDGEVPRSQPPITLKPPAAWAPPTSGRAVYRASRSTAPLQEIALWDQGIPRLKEFTTNGIDGMRVVNQDG